MSCDSICIENGPELNESEGVHFTKMPMYWQTMLLKWWNCNALDLLISYSRSKNWFAEKISTKIFWVPSLFWLHPLSSVSLFVTLFVNPLPPLPEWCTFRMALKVIFEWFLTTCLNDPYNVIWKALKVLFKRPLRSCLKDL